jgi:UDP-glucose 4-epimerase
MVFHCAAVLSHHADAYPELAFDVNVKGTWNLKKACKQNNVKRIIYASTSFVYGDPIEVPINEKAPLKPKGIFEVGKMAAENILQAVYPCQVPYTILRLFNMYGPRSYPDGLYSQATTTFILTALQGKSIEVHADGKQELDFVYVKDAAKAFTFCFDSRAENRVFNVGSGKSTSINQLATTINELTKNPAGIHYNTAHPAYLKTVRADISSIKEAVGWTPTTDMKDGLRETVEFFKEMKQ